MPKRKSKKQRSTKHAHQTKDRVTRTLLKFASHAVSVNYTDKYLYDYVTGNISVHFQQKKNQMIIMIFQNIHEVIKNQVTMINIITDFFIFCLGPLVYLQPKTLNIIWLPNIFFTMSIPDDSLLKKCVVRTKLDIYFCITDFSRFSFLRHR